MQSTSYFGQNLFRILYMDVLKRERSWVKVHLIAFTELMSPGLTDLEYLMLKFVAESLILGLAQGSAHTGVEICSFAAGELPVIMDVFNKL